MPTMSDRATGARRARAVVGLLLLTWGIAQARPHPGLTGPGLVITVGLVLGGAAWLVMTLHPGGRRLRVVGALACGAAGIAMLAAGGRGLPVIYPAAACYVAGRILPVSSAAVLSAPLAAGVAVAALVAGDGPGGALSGAASLLVGLLLGIVSRQRDRQETQTRLLAVETARAQEEHARAATLAERARLAREIHDVLAHSLSALSVQLETAAALLDRGRTATAAEVVDRAGRLAREGLAETRRAVTALRGDPLPLPELITALTDGYRTDLAAPARLTVTGEPRPLSAETGLALYRSAQEGLTNVRRHAAGSPVEVELAYRPTDVRLTVTDAGPQDGSRTPPGAGMAPGYGLTGLRERAELAGGTVTAGPDGAGWRLDVTMPG
ncbi:sensor histidine kinase [Micromonospora mirobrigensis]|uniref:histidine kinase n=1 Tax=Micromonospora mirobrigensis TaxID=262898 RepID=A0A1C5AMB3_9ACTN|nr:sensor histidine kinase [Micromonospora mirobrigensis]SCF46144.1 Signal transduction histidine kinase [Micromonospora mirobrigensis]